EAAKKNFSPSGSHVALGYLPTDEEWSAPNIFEDNPRGPKGVRGQVAHTEGVNLPEHKTWFFYLARICNHCSYPACLAACPRKAIYKRPEDGIVLIDQERCRGYRKCVEACPYKKSIYRGTTRTSEKCIACYPRIEGKDPETHGQPMQTRCMGACIGQIRLQGLVQMTTEGLWKEDRYNPIYYLVHVAKVALPLYPQLGTEPNGYYIPPRWVSRPYLRQMFGPGVDAAIEKYSAPDRELLAVMQLFGKDKHICFRYELKEGPKVFETEIHGKKFEMFNDTIIGYDRAGNEVIRTTVEEPIYERAAQYANSI
ncbi:MAG: 4Fe-4S dicluster domain-containing protein, partial [Gammaproteobacteria bacterium]